MRCEWDPSKARSNEMKHGVSFADAVAVLEDERAMTRLGDHPLEERHVTLGADALGRLLVVAYTWRADAVRIISARPATRAERRAYEEEA